MKTNKELQDFVNSLEGLDVKTLINILQRKLYQLSNTDLTDTEKEMVKDRSRVIQGIGAYSKRTGCGLKEAKDKVEAFLGHTWDGRPLN